MIYLKVQMNRIKKNNNLRNSKDVIILLYPFDSHEELRRLGYDVNNISGLHNNINRPDPYL